MMSTTVLAVLAAAVMSCALSAAGAAAVISDGCDLLDPSPVLLGYDMVNYHFVPSYDDGGKAARGSQSWAVNFRGYQFWFKDRTNRDRFVADPWKYAPRWGGFCSWGVARELPSDGWPWSREHLGPPGGPEDGWVIVDGELIFNIWASYSGKRNIACPLFPVCGMKMLTPNPGADRFMRQRDVNMEFARKRWRGWFGNMRAGPFNTHCIGAGVNRDWCMSPQPKPWIERPCPNDAPFRDVTIIGNDVYVHGVDQLPPPPTGSNTNGNASSSGDIPAVYHHDNNPTNAPVEEDTPLVPHGHEEEPPASPLPYWAIGAIAVAACCILCIAGYCIVTMLNNRECCWQQSNKPAPQRQSALYDTRHSESGGTVPRPDKTTAVVAPNNRNVEQGVAIVAGTTALPAPDRANSSEHLHS